VVEGAVCLLKGGLNPFDLPIRRFTQSLRFLDKLAPTRKGVRLSTQIASLR